MPVSPTQSAEGTAGGTAGEKNGPKHGFATNHALKYPADFTHRDYVNPDAPKGGSITLSGTGTFDTFNPFIPRGTAAAGIGLIYESLMTSVLDEDSAMYGLVAETIEVPEDGSWVEFKIRPEAVFHDGHPITSEDVKWSFETLRDEGRPFYRFYYAAVESIDTPDDRTVRFNLSEGQNNEMPLILGQVIVLPKHYWETRDITKTTLEPPLGSGSHRISEFDTGKSITYERVSDYWAANLPVNRGTGNFDEMVYEYYQDRTIAREAFKAGAIDIWSENSSKEWATGFEISEVASGLIQKEEFPHERVAYMQGFFMNLRKPLFQDIRVREALAYAWDFEWVNKTIMFNAYQRTDSYFDNHELSATGLPSAEELEVLEPFRGQIPERVFTETYQPPATDGSGNNRGNLRIAAGLLKQAGWAVKDGVLTHSDTGETFEFEILMRSDALEPHTAALVRGLERLGIKAQMRIVDDAQYRRRLDTFDYDMTISVIGQSVSPGNEQRDYWGSEAATREASRNILGISDPAIDSLIETLIAAPDREALVTRVKALDRVLLWNHFVIPMYHSQTDRYVYWDRFGKPNTIPKKGVTTDAWWIDATKDAIIQDARGN